MTEKDWPTLNEINFTIGDKPRPPKTYPHFIKGTTQTESPSVLLVRLDWLNLALCGDSVWAYSHQDRNAQTFKNERYVSILAQIGAEKPIHMPWLYFKRGRIVIMDGRHRIYAMIDQGFTHMPILVDPPYVDAVSTLVDEDGPVWT